MLKAHQILEFLVILSITSKATVQSLTFPLTCTRDEDYPTALLHPKQCYFNIDAASEVPDMVLRHGYKLETHEIVTIDGYILTMFRILPKGTPNGKAIVMQAGTTTKSGVFVDKGQHSHAFFFSNDGYEVWLSNVRGMAYSYGHVNLSVTQDQYWNFTMDQMSLIDVRAELNYVHNYTKKPLLYLGHSMGATLGLMYTSAYPEESSKMMSGLIVLAPVVYVLDNNFLPLISAVLQFIHQFYKGGYFYGIETLLSRLLQLICTLVPGVCRTLIYSVFGKSTQLPSEYLMLFFNTVPTGLCYYQIIQYNQIHVSQEFKRYDYGLVQNLKRYGSIKPPLYNLNGIKVPVYVYYGLGDGQVSNRDIQKTLKALGGSVKYARAIAQEENVAFDHGDFLYAKNLTEFLLVKILNDIQSP